MHNPLIVLERCMADAEKAARDALARNDMSTHMEEGANYHAFADAIKKITGTDPRPVE